MTERPAQPLPDQFQRIGPISIGELGQRLGMADRIRPIARLVEDGKQDQVRSALLELSQELAARTGAGAMVADVLELLGGFSDAGSRHAVWEQCISIRSECLAPAHPDTKFVRYLLGSSYASIGRFDRANALLQENLEHFGQRDPSGLVSMQLCWHAVALRRADRLSEALECWDRVLALAEPTGDRWAMITRMAVTTRGLLLAQMGRVPEARAACEGAVRQLEAALPDSAEDLADFANNYAAALGRLDDLEAAELMHQLHVVVALRHGMVPHGRPHARPAPSRDLQQKIEAVWARFPPPASSGPPAAGGSGKKKGLFARILAHLRGPRPQRHA